MKPSIKEKDRGLAKLKKEIEKFKKKPYVKVGLTGKNALAGKKVRDKDGKIKTVTNVDVVFVATCNEFGVPSRGIPERSFIRSTVRDKKEEWATWVSRQFSKILKGESTVEKGLALVGLKAESDIKRKFTENDWPANAPSTIEKKGSSMPLIDTGQTRNSIRYVVVMDGKKKDE